MLGYLIPVGFNRRVLWFNDPRLAHGEAKGQGITLLYSGARPESAEKQALSRLLHDNFWRRQSVRACGAARAPGIGRMMLWGIIYLFTLESRGRTGGLLAALYLLAVLPAFEAAWYRTTARHVRGVVASLRAQTMACNVEDIHLVACPRLDRLAKVYRAEGFRGVLAALDELGLGHLRAFYRRAAWAEKWGRAELPTGLGVLVG